MHHFSCTDPRPAKDCRVGKLAVGGRIRIGDLISLTTAARICSPGPFSTNFRIPKQRSVSVLGGEKDIPNY